MTKGVGATKKTASVRPRMANTANSGAVQDWEPSYWNTYMTNRQQIHTQGHCTYKHHITGSEIKLHIPCSTDNIVYIRVLNSTMTYQAHIRLYTTNEDKWSIGNIFVDEEEQESDALQSRMLAKHTNKPRSKERHMVSRVTMPSHRLEETIEYMCTIFDPSKCRAGLTQVQRWLCTEWSRWARHSPAEPRGEREGTQTHTGGRGYSVPAGSVALWSPVSCGVILSYTGLTRYWSLTSVCRVMFGSVCTTT